MSKQYAIKETTLNSIVDAVNEYSETKVKRKIEDVPNDIISAGQTTTELANTQVDLIQQIKNALAEKATGSTTAQITLTKDNKYITSSIFYIDENGDFGYIDSTSKISNTIIPVTIPSFICIGANAETINIEGDVVLKEWTILSYQSLIYYITGDSSFTFTSTGGVPEK